MSGRQAAATAGVRTASVTESVTPLRAGERALGAVWCAQSQVQLTAQQCKVDSTLRLRGVKQQMRRVPERCAATEALATSKRLHEAMAMCRGGRPVALHVKARLKVRVWNISKQFEPARSGCSLNTVQASCQCRVCPAICHAVDAHRRM